jgi:hypothetical protein
MLAATRAGVHSMNLKFLPGLPDWAIFRLCTYWAIVYILWAFKKYRSRHLKACSFHGTSYVLILTKSGFGDRLGKFS